MSGAGAKTRSLKAQEHLQLLRTLAGELQRAMQAVSSNNLQELEESIANQQDLSTQLTCLASDLTNPPPAQSISGADSIAPDLMLEIRGAAMELQRLNLRYSYLLQHSSRSVALMVSLFNSVKGQLKEVSGPRLKLQTWSCQM